MCMGQRIQVLFLDIEFKGCRKDSGVWFEQAPSYQGVHVNKLQCCNNLLQILTLQFLVQNSSAFLLVSYVKTIIEQYQCYYTFALLHIFFYCIITHYCPSSSHDCKK